VVHFTGPISFSCSVFGVATGKNSLPLHDSSRVPLFSCAKTSPAVGFLFNPLQTPLNSSCLPSTVVSALHAPRPLFCCLSVFTCYLRLFNYRYFSFSCNLFGADGANPRFPTLPPRPPPPLCVRHAILLWFPFPDLKE